MKLTTIKSLYQSFSPYEKNILQQSRQTFECSHDVKFANIECFISYLAEEVITKKRRGEFVPRNIEEAKMGHYQRRLEFV